MSIIRCDLTKELYVALYRPHKEIADDPVMYWYINTAQKAEKINTFSALCGALFPDTRVIFIQNEINEKYWDICIDIDKNLRGEERSKLYNDLADQIETLLRMCQVKLLYYRVM